MKVRWTFRVPIGPSLTLFLMIPLRTLFDAGTEPGAETDEQRVLKLLAETLEL